MPRIRSIVWTPAFRRVYGKRIRATRLQKAFASSMELFIENPRHPLLHTHKLAGSMHGLHAFSVADDCRVIFEFLDDNRVVFHNVGSHDDVY